MVSLSFPFLFLYFQNRCVCIAVSHAFEIVVVKVFLFWDIVIFIVFDITYFKINVMYRAHPCAVETVLVELLCIPFL